MGTTGRRIVMLLAVCALAAPAAASAAEPVPTGGAAVPESAPGLIATPHVLMGDVARFRGSFPASAAGGAVTVERFDATTQAWTAVAAARVRRGRKPMSRAGAPTWPAPSHARAAPAPTATATRRARR